MEQARLLIAIVLSVLVFLAWQLFFVDKGAQQKSAPKTEQTPAKEQPAQPVAPVQPSPKAPESVEGDKAAIGQTEVLKSEKIPQRITVETPLYRVQLSEKGAGITSFVLKQYRETVAKNSPLKELIPQETSRETVLLGFAGNSLPGLDSAVFSTNFTGNTLNVDNAQQQITFSWKSETGVVIEKTYLFSSNSYVIGLDAVVKNVSELSLQDKLFVTLSGPTPKDTRAYGFEGPSAMINGSVEEVEIKKIAEKNTYSGNVQWVAVQGRYFIRSIIPDQVEDASMQLSLPGDHLVEARYINPERVFAPGTQHSFKYALFFGPKSTKVLGEVGHDLGKVVNFGWFDFIAKPCVWLMNKLYGVIPNYGVAIIILTILIKILLWPLGSKSYKSMSEMKKIQPLMQEIREKYKNDKKKMNEEVMSLYRTYKINPLGGCLPMVVQLPVFFALYRMLYQAIELRHAPFFLWIDDLSAPDRLFRFDFSVPFMEPPYGIPVLTIIMGATMLLQQKMSPPMGDPTQAKMMMFMPIIFTVIFINFSSGLVLYWLVNNILSIGQQYYIQKKFS